MKKLKKMVCLLIAALSFLTSVSAYEYSICFDYVINKAGEEPSPIPISYTYRGIISEIEGYAYKKLNAPKGMCITDAGEIFTADTGNSTVVVTDLNGKLLRTLEEGGGTKLKNPEDVFVTSDGEIYVADTGNRRIVKYNKDFTYQRSYTKPNDSAMDPNVTFTPRRVVVSNIGMIYTIAQDSLMTLDQEGNFKGYLGETKSGFDLKMLFIRMFATEQQLDDIGTPVRPSYINIAMGSDNFIYATVVNGGQEAVRKITAVGNNVYKKQTFGLDETQKYQCITVDKRGFIMLFDADRHQFFQYDQDGNNLCAFNAASTHQISLGEAIAYTPSGSLYVLDSGNGFIHKYEPTEFIRNVQDAVYSYGKGEYESSKKSWQLVLEENATYAPAHKGMGNAYYKEKNWQKAMEEYETANDADGYTKAYEKNRTDTSAQYFLWVVLAVVLLLIAVCLIVIWLKRASNHVNDVMLGLKEGGGKKNE